MKNNKGVTFVVVLIVVGIMSVNLILFSALIMQNSFDARKEVNLMKALYVAEAGANMALRELQEGEDGDISQTAFGDGTYEVDTTEGVVVSTGIVNGRRRIVRLNIFNPKAAFSYGVFTDDIQEYRGGGAGASIVVNGDVHSNHATPHINSSHQIVGADYPDPKPGPDYGFPNLDIEYYRTVADNYYTDSTDDTALDNITMPQSGGITLVELRGVKAGRDIYIDAQGNGLLIVIGGNVRMSGGDPSSDDFTGLLYVNDSSMDGTGLGGNVRIGGNYSVKGAVVSRTVNTIHGTSSVTFDSSAFNVEELEVDKDKITVYSWQSS